MLRKVSPRKMKTWGNRQHVSWCLITRTQPQVHEHVCFLLAFHTPTCGRHPMKQTHVCGDRAGLGENDGQVEERCREHQTGGTDQWIRSGRLLPQLPTHLHAAGHAQNARDAGDRSEDQAVGEGGEESGEVPLTRCQSRSTLPRSLSPVGGGAVGLRARGLHPGEDRSSQEERRGPKSQRAGDERHRGEAEGGQHEAAAAEEEEETRRGSEEDPEQPSWSRFPDPGSAAAREPECGGTYFLLSACRSFSQLVGCGWCSGRASMAPRFGSLTTTSRRITAISPRAGVTWGTRGTQGTRGTRFINSLNQFDSEWVDKNKWI